MIKENRNIEDPKAHPEEDVKKESVKDKILNLDLKGFTEEVIASMSKVPKKKFWKETKVGRFLSMRTKTSKAILGVLVTVGSTLLPPPIGNLVGGVIENIIPNISIMEALTDMSLVQIIITVVGFLVVVGVPLLFKGVRDSAIWKVIKGRVDLISDELVKAVDEKSDGGKKITKDEISAILEKAIKDKAKEQ